MRIIAVMNQKGGVGKTTTCANLGAGLALAGRRVLAVDLDPQAHLTASLGLSSESADAYGALDLLRGAPWPENGPVRASGMDVLPALGRLASVDIEDGNTPGREFLLREALRSITRYDYALLDCPPNLGLLTLNAMTAATELLVPLQAEFLAMHSLAALLDTVSAVQRRLNPALVIGGIVCTRFTRQKKLSREALKTIRAHFGGKLPIHIIRENVALAEAPGFGLDIFAYRPGSNGARDHAALSREVLSRERAPELQEQP